MLSLWAYYLQCRLKADDIHKLNVLNDKGLNLLENPSEDCCALHNSFFWRYTAGQAFAIEFVFEHLPDAQMYLEPHAASLLFLKTPTQLSEDQLQ